MSSVFPFTTEAETIITTEPHLQEFKEVAYDFENNCLLLRAGKPYIITKDEALKVWIFKVLKSRRFVYEAYTHVYGTEVDNVIGLIDDKSIIDSEIKRYVIEAIMVNPYIQELTNFTFEHSFGRIYIAFDVTSVYGRFTYESEVYNE